MSRTAGSVARSSSLGKNSLAKHSIDKHSLAKRSKTNRSPAPRSLASRGTAASPAATTAQRANAQGTGTPPRLRLLTAKTGDHPSIHELLVSIFHGPSLAEFHAQLDEPGYAAADRLIVKDGEEIAAHLRLARQTIQVGSTTLPAARFMDLATAPQFRSRGLATALLAAGERAAADRGVLVGITRTRTPELFTRQGWAICGRHTYSEASPRAVLAELAAQAAEAKDSQQTSLLVQHTTRPILVRPLRRIELRAIVQLYEQNLAGRSGWPIRSEEYWEWLLARGACDRVYVASTCADADDFATLLDSIVGYVCVRQSRIVELVATGRDVVACQREDVARQLVERVCADAREQDGWAVRYDGPSGDGLHGLFRRAGGRVTVNQDSGGECFMAKLLDPLAALRRMTSVLAARARAAKLPLPAELGIELRSGGGRKSSAASGVIERYRLLLDRRTARVETGGPSKHGIVLSYSDLTPLLLGDLSTESLLQSSRLRPTTLRAKELALTLFEHETWFRPPLDDLLA